MCRNKANMPIFQIGLESRDVGEKFFLAQFPILYTLEVQKLPILSPINYVRVSRPFQLHVFQTLEMSGFWWTGLFQFFFVKIPNEKKYHPHIIWKFYAN